MVTSRSTFLKIIQAVIPLRSSNRHYEYERKTQKLVIYDTIHECNGRNKHKKNKKQETHVFSNELACHCRRLRLYSMKTELFDILNFVGYPHLSSFTA